MTNNMKDLDNITKEDIEKLYNEIIKKHENG